jgi:hypothetical protein
VSWRHGTLPLSRCILHKFFLRFCAILQVDIFPKIYYNCIIKGKEENNMENKVKSYIEKEYEFTKKYSKITSIKCAIDRCYGIVMFALSEFNCTEDLGDWWGDEMLPKFIKLEEED